MDSLKEKINKEELKQKAIKLGLCPVCGDRLKYITEKSVKEGEIEIGFLFPRKVKKQYIGSDYYNVCSKDENHYKAVNYKAYYDDCWI